jgi:hypothetical protein
MAPQHYSVGLERKPAHLMTMRWLMLLIGIYQNKEDVVVAQVEDVKFVLRLRPALHRQIRRSAKSNNTSMNKEMINILNESFSSSSMNQTLNDLVARLEKKKVI